MATPDEIVTTFIAAIERRDLDAALELVTDDCVYDNVPVGPVHGPDGVARILGPLIEGSDEIEWKVLRTAVHGTIVFNERLDRFRTGSGWVELPVAGVWEVTGDRISLWRDYFDLQQYLSQMS